MQQTVSRWYMTVPIPKFIRRLSYDTDKGTCWLNSNPQTTEGEEYIRNIGNN